MARKKGGGGEEAGWGGGGVTGEGVRSLRSQLARRIRSWFCCSAHRGVHSFLDSQHSSSFAVQADVLSPAQTLAVCTLWCRYSLFGDGCKVNCGLHRCDRQRVCERFCAFFFFCFVLGEIQASHPATVIEEAVFYEATTPVMRCSERRGRTNGIRMAAIREDMC